MPSPQISLLDLIEREELQKIQDAFAEVHDVASVITDVNGNSITEPSNFSEVCQLVRKTPEGARRCIYSDRVLGMKAARLLQPTYQRCLSCGFVDASAPIIVDGHHIANWQISQNALGVGEERIKNYAIEIGADPLQLCQALRKMHEGSLEHFENTLKLLWLMAQQLSSKGFVNLILAREIEQVRNAEKKLEESQENLRSLASELTLAEERTRRKIAANLHDQVGHALVTMQRNLRQALKTNDEHIKNHLLSTSIAHLDDVIEQTRNLTARLSPPLLYDLGLAAALESLGDEMFSPQHIDFIFNSPTNCRFLEQEVSIMLYHMIKEIFINVLKHARATAVQCLITNEDSYICVAVHDDGIGFNPSQAIAIRKRSFGLFSIRERLRHWEGQMNINSSKGQGTSVIIKLPLKNNSEEGGGLCDCSNYCC
jgi:signal transduction histidine kinase